VAGGPAQILCDVADGRGGSWGSDGFILYSQGVGAGLFQVPASGGKPVAVTIPDTTKESGGHLWPSFLPDGRHYTYLSVGNEDEGSWITIGSLDGGEPRRLVGSDSGAFYVEPGLLLFLRQGTLLAQPLDLRELRMTGDPVPVAEGVSRNRDTQYSAFSLSNNGILAYKSGADLTKQFWWFDRSGKPLEAIGPQGDVRNPEFSPDGSRLVFERVEPGGVQTDIWLLELSRGTASRLTFEPQSESYPVWSREGTHVFYNASRENARGVFRKHASGAGSEELVVAMKDPEWMRDISRDGAYLVGILGGIGRDILMAPMKTGAETRPFMKTPFDESSVRVSPDGRFIAYDSDESGQVEVYVQSFPEPGGKWQVSSNGGVKPKWRDDGKELYFLALDRTLMAVPVSAQGGTFQSGEPTPLFLTELPAALAAYSYAATSRGDRFVVARPAGGGTPAPFTVVLNWAAKLAK